MDRSRFKGAQIPRSQAKYKTYKPRHKHTVIRRSLDRQIDMKEKEHGWENEGRAGTGVDATTKRVGERMNEPT